MDIDEERKLQENNSIDQDKLLNNAISALETDDFTTCEVLLKKILEKDPNCPGALDRLGYLYARAGKLDLAEELLIRTIVIDPANIKAINNLGNIYYERKEYSRAQEKYEQAMLIDPAYAKAYMNLALIYKKKGKISKFVKLYRKGKRIEALGNFKDSKLFKKKRNN